MGSPKLSFFLVDRGVPRSTLGRFRTRAHMGLGERFHFGPVLLFVVGLGWEGERFVVNVA